MSGMIIRSESIVSMPSARGHDIDLRPGIESETDAMPEQRAHRAARGRNMRLAGTAGRKPCAVEPHDPAAIIGDGSNQRRKGVGDAVLIAVIAGRVESQRVSAGEFGDAAFAQIGLGISAGNRA